MDINKIKEILINDIKPKLDNQLYDKRYLSDKIYESHVNIYILANIVESLCKIMIDYVENQETENTSDNTDNICLKTDGYQTWTEYVSDKKNIDKYKRELIDNYTCSPNMKCLLYNINSHKIIITKFIPSNITIDWRVIHSENLLGPEIGIATRILRGLGWYD